MTDQQPQGADPAGSTPQAGSTAPAGTDPEGAASDPAGRLASAGSSPSNGGVTSEGSVTMRRAPRYPRFILLGAGLGAIVAYILTAAFPIDPLVGFAALFGYFALIGVSAGAAIGGLVAIALDTVATRRAKTMGAERTVVDPTPEDVEGDLED
ncbi:hypothetical protein ABIB15_002493 [Marisediminicola sp. UYEF4]|uniref:hypothetical protein n=1 Tax=Marisediminicola sp. UYEF4 TaxID=1756384 RepID=UPI003395C209